MIAWAWRTALLWGAAVLLCCGLGLAGIGTAGPGATDQVGVQGQ